MATSPPNAGQTYATVVHDSADNPITLNLSGDAATSITLNASAGYGTVTISGTRVTYTPRAGYSGSDNFGYFASNAAGNSGAAAVYLTISGSPPIAGAVNATVASGSSNNPITLNLSGGAATAVAAATFPAHGTVSISGTNMTYTPTAGYNGSDSFRYTARNADGTSSPATINVTITEQAPSAGPASATVAQDSSNNPITLNFGNGAATSVAVVTAAEHGTVTIRGTSMTYTPTAGYFGSDNFSYTGSNSTGTSGTGRVFVTISQGAPTAVAHSATVNAGGTVAVDLTAGASGGPFVGANILTVTPAAAGSATVRAVVSNGVTSYLMDFVAASTFSGTATINYNLSNASALSSFGSVSVTLATHLNVAGDRQVTGLIAAQSASANRFATAQMSNFTRRLERLHGEGWAASSFGISLPASSTTPRLTDGFPLNNPFDTAQKRNIDGFSSASVQPYLRKSSWSPQTAAANGNQLASNENAAAPGSLPELSTQAVQPKQALALWIGGAVDFGQQRVTSQQEGFKFSTNGVSVGLDYRISDLATVGFGTGFSRAKTDIGENGSKNSSESATAALYGSLRPTKNIFIDGILGYGALNFSSSRYLTDGGGFANGLRQGGQLFTALMSGMEFRKEGWMWSPYGRMELTSTTLNKYSETAANSAALTYFKQVARTSSATLGARIEGQYVSRLGIWVPQARLEFGHQFQGAGNATMAYSDAAASGPVYNVQTTNLQTGNWAAGIGAKLLRKNGVVYKLDYYSNINLAGGHSQSIAAWLEVPMQ